MTRTQITSNDLFQRRVSAIFLIAGLWLCAKPFSPGTYFLPYELGSMIDMFLCGPIFMIGLYFQWQISGVIRPLMIMIPTGPGSTQISGGRVRNNTQYITWLYQPADYWKLIGAEVAILAVMYQLHFGLVHQVLGCIVFGSLWAVGWFCTPEYMKLWAWEHMKQVWFWMTVRMMMEGGTRRRRY